MSWVLRSSKGSTAAPSRALVESLPGTATASSFITTLLNIANHFNNYFTIRVEKLRSGMTTFNSFKYLKMKEKDTVLNMIKIVWETIVIYQ